MGKIVAAGGGETRAFDRLAVSLTGVSAPHLLFLPTAGGDDPREIEAVRAAFGTLGCETRALCLCAAAPDGAEIAAAAAWADLIYAGDGDPVAMMARWRACGADQALRAAYARGAVMAGAAAGAVCWFEFGPAEGGGDLWGFARVRGLGLLPAACCPHYDSVPHEDFDRMMEGLTLAGVGLGDGAALVEEDGVCRLVKARPGAEAELLYMLRGELCRRALADGETVSLRIRRL